MIPPRYFLRMVSPITVLLLLVFCAEMLSADENDLIKLGSGLQKKVIVRNDNVKLFPDGPGKGAEKMVAAFSIYFQLWVDKAKEEDSKESYFRVGNSFGEQIGWISEKDVFEWNTRLLLLPNDPDPATPEITFRVLRDDGKPAKFLGSAGGNQRRVAAPILQPVKKGPNPDYEVAFFAGTSTAHGTAPVGANVTLRTRRKMEIVFVIDTTGSMAPLIEGIREVAAKAAGLLAGAGEVGRATRFGLVQYRDLGEGPKFSAGSAYLETKLTDVKTFQESLAGLTPDGGGDVEEDVLAGLLLAIEGAGWSENSSKHIILLGDASAHLSGPKNTTGLTIATVIGKAQTDAGSELNTRLGTIMFHAIQAEQGGSDAILCKEQFRRLAANGDKVQGHFDDFNPLVESETKETIERLHEFFKSVAENLERARAGDIAGLKEAAAGEGVAAIPAKALYSIAMAAGDDPIQPVERGTAKLRSEDGDLLARQMVLVSENDLRRLRSTLDLLEVSLGQLANPAKRKDVGSLLEVLKGTLVRNLAGQKITENTSLDELITALPLRTDVLKTTALDLQKKDADSFKKWIEDLVAAKTRANSLIEDEKTDWHQLSEEAANARYAYIRMDDMP
jgi:hypothetical protein